MFDVKADQEEVFSEVSQGVINKLGLRTATDNLYLNVCVCVCVCFAVVCRVTTAPSLLMARSVYMTLPTSFHSPPFSPLPPLPSPHCHHLSPPPLSWYIVCRTDWFGEDIHHHRRCGEIH